MKDFPIFTTENGVASLVLREIPYNQKAYIKLMDTLEPEALLNECCQFCTVVGAEHIYASGDPFLQRYPLYAHIHEMERIWTDVPNSRAKAISVTGENVSQWKDIYNRKMGNVPNSAHMDDAAAKEMLDDGSGYFVERDGELIGIGKGTGDTIDAVASVVPGAGEDVVLALCRQLGGKCFRLQVADTNTRAISLYDRLGFVITKEISCWYKIF